MVVTCCKKKNSKSSVKVLYSRTDHYYFIPFLTLKLYTITTQQACQNLKATKHFRHNGHGREAGRQLKKRRKKKIWLNNASSVWRSSLPHMLYSLSSESALSKQPSPCQSAPCSPSSLPRTRSSYQCHRGMCFSCMSSFLTLVLWTANIFCLLFPPPTAEVVSTQLVLLPWVLHHSCKGCEKICPLFFFPFLPEETVCIINNFTMRNDISEDDYLVIIFHFASLPWNRVSRFDKEEAPWKGSI